MKKASIRELKHATASVLDLVAQGQSIEVTKHNRVVAILTPPPAPKKITRPDFAARMKAAWGGKVLESTWDELINEDRGDR